MVQYALMESPRSVSAQITGCCNLRCRYCYYAAEMTTLSDLPASSWCRFFGELGQIGVMDVCLSGGEPLCRPDLFDLVDALVENRMRYSILSNGTLVDDRLLARFDVGKRRVRLDYVQVSVDGSCAEVHDLTRPGSFDRAMRGLKLMRDAGIPVVVRVTINRHNLDDLENVARLLLEELGLPSFGTNEAVPIGAGCSNEADLSLRPADQHRAMRTLERLLARYPGRITAQAGPQAKIGMFAELREARSRGGVENPRWSTGKLSACGCVFSRIDVLHDGSIVPCAMLPSLVLGNFTSDSIAEVWRSHPVLEAMRQRRDVPTASVAECADCEWASYCNGGCPALPYQLHGDLYRPNPLDCYRRFVRETGDDQAETT